MTAEKPYRRLCGARKKNGPGRCRMVALLGKRRCMMHGGRLPGAPKGVLPKNHLQRAAGYAKWVALRRALGIPGPGGFKKKVLPSMVERAKQQLSLAIEDLQSTLPAVPSEEPTAQEMLGRLALKGMQRLDAIISTELTEADVRGDPKLARLVGDMSIAAIKMHISASAEAFKARDNARLTDLLERIAEEKRLQIKEGT